MGWQLYRWVWLIRSPLYVGTTPAGALNRTRLYIPARAMWGAITAELARRQNTSFPDYKTLGEALQKQVRFSYLFPAEKTDQEWKAWLPFYMEKKGLVWQREDKKELRNRIFRMQLLITQHSTAIAPESDTAEEGSLRELELISPFWRDGDAISKPVAMVGYLFCQNEDFYKNIYQIEEIFVGGDTRYGLGRLKRISCVSASTFFNNSSVDLQRNNPVIRTSHIFAHAQIHTTECPIGAMELLGSWDSIRAGFRCGNLMWVPGSSLKHEQEFEIQEDGTWIVKSKQCIQ
ncbi:hypothetical protein [Pseudothermotoga sp.]|uniref:hypothetical protein n=1 Tax=Pseudothermotoga sp. TaxID=2033661 RepID=UPI0031F64728